MAIEHIKSLTMDTFIFMDTINNIYLLLNHIKLPSSKYNHPDKLLIAHILATAKASKHDVIIRKVRAHTNTIGNDKGNKLAKKGEQEPKILVIPFHPIGKQMPYSRGVHLSLKTKNHVYS